MTKYGWRPGVPDQRDLKLQCSWPLFKKLPASLSLRNQLPPVWNQHGLGACTAFSTLATWYHLKGQQIAGKLDDDTNIFKPSFLFQYYNTRKIENTVEFDSGATIGDAFKALQKYGACPESIWPYSEKAFATLPPKNSYEKASSSQLLKYFRLAGSLRSVKACLADGYIIAAGFSVYDSFEDPNGVTKTGIMTMPGPKESLLGGHAITIIGFNDKKKALEVRNSWGDSFGDSGHFWMPYDIFNKQGMISDFYSPRLVE